VLALRKLVLFPVTMPKIATSTSDSPRRFANAPTHSPSCEIQGIHKGYSTATMRILFYLCALSSLWIYRVQGETERDFRRGDKRCVYQKYFNLTNQWKVRIDWVGADVLVVAPTGMGKVGCLIFHLNFLSCCKDPVRVSAFKSLRSPKLFVHPFCPQKQST
jgi:hypothetical protein